MKDIVRKITWGAVALVVIGTFWVLWKQSQPETEVYELCKVTNRNISETITATGHLEARQEVEVKPKTTGTVVEVLVRPGDKVMKGQVIARIQVAPNPSGVSDAQGRVTTARLVAEQAKKEYDRVRTLYDKKILSRQDYERAENALNIANGELRTALDALDILRTGSSKVAGNATTVLSPLTGTVLDVPVRVGSSVVATNADSEGTTVAVVAEMNEIVFRGYVDEIEVGKLSVGMPVNIMVGAMTDVRLQATLDFISPKSMERSGATVFEIKAKTMIPENFSARSGYSANAEIVTATYRDALSVEETAVEFEGEGKAYVWLLTSDPADEEEQEFDRVRVEIGGSDGLYVEIRKGVKKGDLLRGLLK